MDHARSNNIDENVGIPDDLRCKRSDGKQWRCTALSMPDKTVCEKHYIQAKKRAANSAMRANLKKSKPDSDVNLETGKITHASHDGNAATEYSDGASDSSQENGGQTCHQCRKSVRDRVTWCLKCDRRGYCDSCISTCYSDISLDEIQKICPACRVSKISGFADIKVRIREIPVLDKLQYLHVLLSSVLPVVKQIHNEQCFEVELEKKLRGAEIDLPRTKLNADEQMCCNLCRIPITDYHRRCPSCSYDLCLICCRDLREATVHQSNEPQTEHAKTTEQNLLSKFPHWRSNENGSVPCPPKEYGGCGYSSLNLSRIFKMNWVAKLGKNVEEMIDIELGQFMKGYSEGCILENGSPQLLKLKDWPSPSASEEFLLYQRPDFISKLPLLHIQFKFLLTLYTVPVPFKFKCPKFWIVYPNSAKKKSEVVYLLVHTSEVKLKDWQRPKVEIMQKTYKESEVNESHGDPNICSRGISPDSSLCTKINGLDLESDQKDSTMDQGFEVYSSAGGGNTVNCEIPSRQNGDVSEITHPGVLWDVFRRQDVPKVTEYLKMHWKEFGKSDDISTVQLGLDFLSPESLGEAVRLAEEVRRLPNEHEAKLQVLEVGKISLYAASSAIKEVQKLVLDPKLGGEIGYGDPNLTAMVSENYEKMSKRRQITCA
ncbi:hypothetical protein TSUD_31540 [Trifolium subterraneum]|uniref:WRC domain-containing protein n=1 Tax=Trifolium subterraneum TaxID=3900 RepID=A0A2Z6MC42_TRISU|nr:hypothetical protein TSUD_31540 [Trifolium subterraneum]